MREINPQRTRSRGWRKSFIDWGRIHFYPRARVSLSEGRRRARRGLYERGQKRLFLTHLCAGCVYAPHTAAATGDTVRDLCRFDTWCRFFFFFGNYVVFADTTSVLHVNLWPAPGSREAALTSVLTACPWECGLRSLRLRGAGWKNTKQKTKQQQQQQK